MFKQKGNPFPVTPCGRRRNYMSPLNAAEPRRTIGKGKNFNKVSKDKSATGGAAGGGMTQKGVNEYKRSSKTNVKGARKKGATLRDWFEKEDWRRVDDPSKKCGE